MRPGTLLEPKDQRRRRRRAACSSIGVASERRTAPATGPGMASKLTQQGERHRAARGARDWTKIFVLPTVGATVPAAETPPAMALPLYEYQKRSLARMLAIEEDGRIMLPRGAPGAEEAFTFRGGVIADEVGMGKTAQLIGLFLASPAAENEPSNLVVTPGHLCQQWAKEISKFAPTLRVAVVADAMGLGPNAHQIVVAGAKNHDVIITSLEVILGQSAIQSALFGLSWRRIVYDECHEVIALSDPARQSMLENLAQRSRNVWCVSGTPFPHHDASMYGIHQLLGVKYKVHIVDSPFARNKPLSEGHPFQMVKRRFYLKNTPASVGSEWERIGGTFKFRVRTTKLNMTLTERGFYDEQYRKLTGKNGYGPVFLPLRQLCDHPAACKDWADALESGGSQPLHTLDDLRARFIKKKQEDLERMAADRARTNEQQEAARNATAVVNQLNPIIENLSSEDLENGGLVTWPDGNPNYRLVNANGGVNLRRRHVLKQWLLGDMCQYDARQHFLTLTDHWLKTSNSSLERMAKEETAVRKELGYFQTVLQELDPEATSTETETETKTKTETETGTGTETDPGSRPATGGTEGGAVSDEGAVQPAAAAAGGAAAPQAAERECIICSDTDMAIVSMAPCGHYFCTSCLQKWLVDHQDCPTCRQPIHRNDVMWIHLEMTRNAAGSLLTRRFGTKPAALVQFIQAENTADPSSRFIVFSMWHAMLKLVQNTLEANGIPVAVCDSKTDADNEKAIETFRTSPTVKVIMLSMEHAAAGTNLQAANHVILLEPPGVNPAHGVAQETQAIGRAARLGQERVINITRFVINDTIESQLHKQNHDQRMVSESGRRFACDTPADEDGNMAAGSAAAAAAPSTVTISCAVTPPDARCFDIGAAAAIPTQQEPLIVSAEQTADGTGTVSALRASLLELAREQLPPLHVDCRLSLYFAGQQLCDAASDGTLTELRQFNIQRGSQLHGLIRAPEPAPEAAPAASADASPYEAQVATLTTFYAKVGEVKDEAACRAIVDKRREGAASLTEADFSKLCQKLQDKYNQDPLAVYRVSLEAEVEGTPQREEIAENQAGATTCAVDEEQEQEQEQEDEEDDDEEDEEEGLTADQINGMKVVELRAELKNRGLPTSGRRAVLVGRLTGSAAAGAAAAAPVSSGGRKRTRSSDVFSPHATQDDGISPAASPISTPGSTAEGDSSASAPSDEERTVQPKRSRASESSAAASGAATAAASPAPAAAVVGSRHCDREAALRAVIAMGFTPQRAARLQKAGASPGSDGVGDTEKLLGLLLGDDPPAAAAAAPAAAAAAVPAAASDDVMDLTQDSERLNRSSWTDDCDLGRARAFGSSQPTAAAAAAPRPHHAAARKVNPVETANGGGSSGGMKLLAEMGFVGFPAERALKRAGGDVQEALATLLYRASVL